jgi:hypothetical protein
MPSTRLIPTIRLLGVGGWVFVNRPVPICPNFAVIDPKKMSTGLARMSAMLSGMMTPLDEAIELLKES